MSASIDECLIGAIETAEGLYHQLVLVVGLPGSGKTAALRDLSKKVGQDVMNVNLTLSEQLLEMTEKQRSLQLQQVLSDCVSAEQSPVLLDNLEILFDAGLQQDPLRLLQGLSRNQSLVASWSGSVANGKLTYAEPGHPEYRTYPAEELIIVTVGDDS